MAYEENYDQHPRNFSFPTQEEREAWEKMAAGIREKAMKEEIKNSRVRELLAHVEYHPGVTSDLWRQCLADEQAFLDRSFNDQAADPDNFSLTDMQERIRGLKPGPVISPHEWQTDDLPFAEKTHHPINEIRQKVLDTPDDLLPENLRGLKPAIGAISAHGLRALAESQELKDLAGVMRNARVEGAKAIVPESHECEDNSGVMEAAEYFKEHDEADPVPCADMVEDDQLMDEYIKYLTELVDALREKLNG